MCKININFVRILFYISFFYKTIRVDNTRFWVYINTPGTQDHDHSSYYVGFFLKLVSILSFCINRWMPAVEYEPAGYPSQVKNLNCCKINRINS